MAAVYVSNLIINVGSDFSQSFTLQSSDSNSAFNLSNYTVESKMRKWSGSSSAITFNAEIYDPAYLGRILISLNSTTTLSIKPGRYIYDVIVTNQSDGSKNRVIEGTVLVREGATY